VDDSRFGHRMPTRAAAVRELLKLGLTVNGADGGRMKSSSYGFAAVRMDTRRAVPNQIRLLSRIRPSR
jgi:hypothetical protein